jgi:hypothetical protein
MNWILLDVPLCAVFFLAIAGIPLWLVIRHPDAGPADSGAAADGGTAWAAAMAVPMTGQDSGPATVSDSRELVGAAT